LEKGIKHGEWLNCISGESIKIEKLGRSTKKRDKMDPKNFGIHFIKILRKIIRGIKIYIIYNDEKYTQTIEI
jgi:hypothetical protein